MKCLDLDYREQNLTNFVFNLLVRENRRPLARWARYSMTWASFRSRRLSSVQLPISSVNTLAKLGPELRNYSRKPLGKFLPINEAYRLGEGRFASEAVNELVDQITKPKLAGKLVVILCGIGRGDEWAAGGQGRLIKSISRGGGIQGHDA